ncbi:hypothetical protein TTHERM_00663900 (macronuclear) [Tetrahymena thermophila SB210]|uniref:Uncharacterized protein n=1 Tax=Tetrahymena thermophila (strain SB210) TaxID=312017 RepID=I7M2D7_TETTS|nr:hypothetical protein TTHERM_00663900 [Tetrahymena thermophila SB210]EAR99911.2 hypothetical protein TTHERM_00663900 [Tetrahymena thermophila SB210]|eukprot:XP_001020156.2 hypothetical protein TTHERM_00663900 [Tetrahymena thermophila SB210]
MYSQYQAGFQNPKVASVNLLSQSSTSRLKTEEDQQDLAKVEQFIQHLKNEKQVVTVPRQNLKESSNFQNMNHIQQQQMLKSSVTSHLQSPINNIRDIQQQLQNIDYTPLAHQQNQSTISNIREEQKQYSLNEKSSTNAQSQSIQSNINQNYQSQQINGNINQVSVSQLSVGTNLTTQNGSLNYVIPAMPSNLIASPYNKVQNTSQGSIINSAVNIIKSPKYDRELMQTSQLSTNQNSGEEHLKSHISQLTTEIAILTEKLQKMELQNEGKKLKQSQYTQQKQHKKDRKNSSKSSRSSSYSSSNSSNSNTSNSSSEREQDDPRKRDKKRKKSKQLKKQQENEIERLMQQYLNYVHVDRYQLNLFRDSFVSENNFYKLKDSKDYKTLFHKSLIVLIQNLEKIKPLVIQSSVLYANSQGQALKNMNSINGNGIQQPSLSHASSAAHLGQIFQNTNSSNISTNGFSQSTNLMLSKMGIINSNSTHNLQSAQEQQEDQNQLKTMNQQQKNLLYQQQQQLKDVNGYLYSSKQQSNLNSGRDPNQCQTERGAQSKWDSQQQINQNFAQIRGSHYVPKSAGISNGKSSSPGNQKQRVVQSTSYQNENIQNEISQMDRNYMANNQLQNHSVSKHQIQKTFSFMPRESLQNQITNQYNEQVQIRESYKINDNQLNGSGIQHNLLHSRESFGVNIKHNQQMTNPNLPGYKQQTKQQGQNKKNNLQLEDIPDDEGINNQHQNIESAKFKYSQNDFNDKMKQYSNNQDYILNEQQRIPDQSKPKRSDQKFSQQQNPNLNDNGQKHNIHYQQQSPKQPYQEEYNYEEIPDNYSNNSERQKRSKSRNKSSNRYETEKRASTLNEIDFDTQSVNSKSSKYLPNDEAGRQRYYTANLQHKNGNDERLRTSQNSRVSIHRDSKKEIPANEQCTHVGCPNGSCCIHIYAQQKQKKERTSHFFKTQERDEKIIPDISQIPKRAKPAIQFQKTNFDIITNTEPSKNKQ